MTEAEEDPTKCCCCSFPLCFRLHANFGCQIRNFRQTTSHSVLITHCIILLQGQKNLPSFQHLLAGSHWTILLAVSLNSPNHVAGSDCWSKGPTPLVFLWNIMPVVFEDMKSLSVFTQHTKIGRFMTSISSQGSQPSEQKWALIAQKATRSSVSQLSWWHFCFCHLDLTFEIHL